MFCKEAIVWRGLENPNIVQIPSYDIDHLRIFFPLHPKIPEYIKDNPAADRVALVGVCSVVFVLR